MLYRATLRINPDLVVEIGRGYGNSTVVFLEAARKIETHVLSIGYDDLGAFERRTLPRLRRMRGRGLFEPLEMIDSRAEEVDLELRTRSARRVLLFWDAHGEELADYLLTSVVPGLPGGSWVILDDVYTGPAGREALSRYEGFWSPFEELSLLGYRIVAGLARRRDRHHGREARPPSTGFGPPPVSGPAPVALRIGFT